MRGWGKYCNFYLCKQECYRANKKFEIFNLIWEIDKMSLWTLNEPATHLTLEYQINVGLRLLNFEPFSQAYALIRYPTFINFPTHAGTRLRTSWICCISMYVCTTYSLFSLDRRCGWKLYGKLFCLLNGVVFSVFLVLAQKFQVPSFHKNSQGYVYFIPYVY